MKLLKYCTYVFIATFLFGCGGGGGGNGGGGGGTSSTLRFPSNWVGSFTGTNHTVVLAVTFTTSETASGNIYNTYDNVPGIISGTIDNNGNMNFIFNYQGGGNYKQIGTVSINSAGNLVGSYTEYDNTGRPGLQGTVVATGMIDLSPVVQSSVNITGEWQGSVTETAFGTNIVTLYTGQLPSGAVTGIYSSVVGTGSLAGTISGYTLTCTLSPNGCTGVLNGTGTVTGDFMTVIFSGSYNCNGKIYNDSGTGTLTKQ